MIICRFLIFKEYDHTNKFSWFFGSVGATYQRFLIVTPSYNAKLGKTLKYAKQSHRSSTSNASFIVFNVTCEICGLCGLYARTLTQTCGYMDINKIHLQYINTTTNSTAKSRKTSWGVLAFWKSVEISPINCEWNAFQQGPRTHSERAKRFNSRKSIYII